MTHGALSIEAAIDEFVAKKVAQETPSGHAYKTALGRLRTLYGHRPLDDFEPPQGTDLIKGLMDAEWGERAPQTYRTNLSLIRTFFAWHVEAGHLQANPTDGLTYPPIERKPRRLITREETEQLLEANAEPRDQVPLRLLLSAGLAKAPVRTVRFRDLDAAAKTVTYQRRGRAHVPTIPDDDFWAALLTLTEQRAAEPDDFVLCEEYSRRDTVTADELAAMDRDGSLDQGRSYLWQEHDGSWYRANLTPHAPRGSHGTHLWWYRCAARAGLVPPGATSGFPMMSARYTFGRRRFTRVGSLADLQHELGGLGRGGSAGEVYRDNADLLNKSLRVVRRRLGLSTSNPTVGAVGLDGSRPPQRWWKEPVRVFAEYVDDERDLVELSRVSVEMLRTENVDSEQLHEAAETLTRAVTAAELVERARAESDDDHPLLHGHGLVAAWSAMETMIGDIVGAWLLSWPAARSKASSIVTSPAAATSPDEWEAEVQQALQREYQKLNKKARSPRRLDYFEWLLDTIGLGLDPNDADPQIRTNLWEMQQIRNVFAHKRGVADARMAKNNPTLPFRVGDQIRIDRNAWSDFLVTTVLYADEIVRRMKRELDIKDWQRLIPAPAIRYPRARS